MKAFELVELMILLRKKITVSWYWLYFWRTFFIMVNDCMIQCEESYVMKKMIIHGGKRLSGELTIGGAKNSTVALIPAAILADTPVQFDTVPHILDVHNLRLILESMNVHSTFENDVLTIDPTNIEESELPSHAIKSLRASYYFNGDFPWWW